MQDERIERLKKLELRLAKLALREKQQKEFLPFVKAMWPEFISGRHHEIIAQKFEALADGKIRRLIITMPPRHTKSEFASYLLPAWMMGRKPNMKIIQATHTAELAVGFGRKVKNLLLTDQYHEVFPETELAADSQAAGRWNTSKGGDYHALGVGGAMAGKGADLCVIDDPHSEADALSATALQYAYEWFTSGPRQRLQPGGRILIVMCVEENQRVLMADGTWQPIKALQVGDSVVSLAFVDQPGGTAVSQTVTGVKRQGEDDLLRVVSRSCAVKVNARHPFLVVKGGRKKSPETQAAQTWSLEWVRAEHLVPGDTVVTVKNTSQNFRFEDIEAVEPAGRGVVYDISVTGDENFVAEGFVVHNTRWGDNDLVGNLLRAQAKQEGTDQWEVVNFPAILPSGNPCWPEMWSKKELLATKASIPLAKWNSQYQQDPTSDAVSIIKREWWQLWDKKDNKGNLVLPVIESVIQAYDTAYSNSETSDFSAISTWGVFYPEEDGPAAIILLDCKRGRWEFPLLKTMAKQEMAYWEPETVVIEAKASGLPLAQELRRAGIPVVTFSPSRGNDRMTRVNSVAPVFESGLVWAPGDSTGFQPFAEEIIEECAAFPRGQNDDMLDTAVLAIMRYRKGNYVKLETDVEEEPRERRVVAYY